MDTATFVRDNESMVGSSNLGSEFRHYGQQSKVKKYAVVCGLLLLVTGTVAGVGFGVYKIQTPNNDKGYSDVPENQIGIFDALTSDDQGQQGGRVPRTSSPTGQQNVRALPGDAQIKHPVSLLHEMLLDPVFTSSNCPDFHPFFKVIATVQSQTFTGYGRNKKIAKKMAAQFACNKLYNLTYTDLPASIQPLAEKCGI